MTKRKNHDADIKNRNLGTDGTNITYDKAQGHRGWQKNPENPKQGGRKK